MPRLHTDRAFIKGEVLPASGRRGIRSQGCDLSELYVWSPATINCQYITTKETRRRTTFQLDQIFDSAQHDSKILMPSSRLPAIPTYIIGLFDCSFAFFRLTAKSIKRNRTDISSNHANSRTIDRRSSMVPAVGR